MVETGGQKSGKQQYINVLKYSNECRDNTLALVTQLNPLILEQLWWNSPQARSGTEGGIM